MQTSKKNTLDVLLVRMSAIFTSLEYSLDTFILTSDILFVNQNIISFRQFDETTSKSILFISFPF